MHSYYMIKQVTDELPELTWLKFLEKVMAKLTFYGATNGVTGSAYLIETERAMILLECGLLEE